MKKNLIILTGGLSGSSLLAGLLSKTGYWLGHNTKKIRYQTYENSSLVELNKKILLGAEYTWKDTMDIPPPSIDKLRKISIAKELGDHSGFIKTLNENVPWLWKDPRLCYTIYYWKEFVDLKSCNYILMKRNMRQAWTGLVLRGKMPISYKDFKIVEGNCIEQSNEFLKAEKLNYISLTFEDIILNPESIISKLNKFLCTDLKITDLKDIYKGELYKLRWSIFNFLFARIKYHYYKYVRRDVIIFPRVDKGPGSGWKHINAE